MKSRPRRPPPTQIQDIALKLTFAVMDESRFNRGPDEYKSIAARLLPLKVLTAKINQLLEQAHRSRGQVFMTATEENWPGELAGEVRRWIVNAGKLEAA